MFQAELFPRQNERNTNINEILFRVGEEPVYVGTDKKPIGKFKAIVGFPLLDDFTREVYSVVSEDYQLVTNQDALDYAHEVFKQLFNTTNTDNFEVFHILYPKSKSYCHVDIIDKHHQVNVWKQEVYLLYIRMTNSYNKTFTLRFSLGFCRKLCNNGIIFEKETIEVRIAHTKTAMNRFRLADAVNGIDRLKKLELAFTSWLHQLHEYPVDTKYVLPLCAKILNQTFDIKTKNWDKLETESKRLHHFSRTINALTDRYVKEMGLTAYTVHNIATDYATHQVRSDQVNTYQRNTGRWLEEFCAEIKGQKFSLEQYLINYQYLIK